MHRSIRKRILSGILAGVLILSNVSGTVSAAGLENNTTDQTTDYHRETVDNKEENETESNHADETKGESVSDTGTESASKNEEPKQETTSDPNNSSQENLDNHAEAEINTQDMAPSAQAVVTGTFRISGKIEFDETLGGTDWSSLVRPAEFEQPIKIVQTYTDSKGVEQTVTFDAQENVSQNDFYLKFSHDGEGGGEFVVENVPKTIIDADGVECQVTGCTVNVEPTLIYYKSETPITVDMTHPDKLTAAVGTLKLSLKSQKLTLQPTVVPEGGTDHPSFRLKAEYTNPELTGEEDKDRKLDLSYSATKDQPAEVLVPVGMNYSLSQQTTEGYLLDENYSITATETKENGEKVTTSTSSKGTATGTIVDRKDLVISTKNYAQNVEVGFDVRWIDNNKATRPELSEDNFVLQYRTADGEWTELTSDQYDALNMKTSPVFDKSQSARNQYSYKGLPAVDAQGRELQYQVLIKKNPDTYVSTYEDSTDTGRRTFLLEEQTDFQATVTWKDISGKDDSGVHKYRPDSLECLKLYRRTGNGTYELVYDTLPEGTVTSGDSSWTVNISNIPRYSADNQEYDYVLVQGSIDENNSVSQTTIDNYKTYYNNGTGSFGNDTALCHNHGTITEVLHNEVNFRAGKIWKDPEGTGETRPDCAVTLWRYVKSKADSIDDAYAKGLASQVVFQTNQNGTVKENIVSYQIDNTKGSTDAPQEITFTAETVSGMPEDYQLPLYDDHGQEYVYFVRESLSGEQADEFEIQYTYTDGNGNIQTCKNGAPTDGTITNVRRKKAAVNVTKVWRDPSGLEKIDGALVQVKIKASADGGATFDELSVYSEKAGAYDVLDENAKKKAQTITGFTASLSQGEVTYYVNVYDKEGRPYDMEHARIEETVQIGEKEYTISQDDAGNQILEIDGNRYIVSTSYESEEVLGDGTIQYRYQQNNTITALRDYKIIKEWDESIPDEEIAEIKSVSFRLERRSTKDNPDGTPGAYELVKDDTGEEVSDVWNIESESGRTWSRVIENLPKYDSEGYEYYYRATEISINYQDGHSMSMENALNQKQWTGEHYRTTEQTKVVNHKYSESNDFFTVSKLWQDNGDTVETDDTRKNVQIRIYRRSQLKEALEKWKEDQKKLDTDIVDLDSLGALNYFQTTLTSNDQYTQYVYYRDLEKKIDGALWDDTQKDDWKNYIVVEYCVGDKKNDGAETARYSYEQLSAATDQDFYTFSGNITNKYREYHTQVSCENNARQVLLTNTRIGTTKIHVKKTWNDEENAVKGRPASVQFQIYQDGAAYTNLPDYVTVEGKDDDNYTVAIDLESGKVTVTGKGSNTAKEWEFTVKGLNMFSSTAAPHTYSIDELANESVSGSGYHYILKKESPSVEETSKTQTYSFAFENTISGTKSHIAYKYWKDSGAGADNRPDLYMNLYRYLKKDLKEAQKKDPDVKVEDLSSYELYTDYKDQIWAAEPENAGAEQPGGPGGGASDDYERGYNWKVTINDLPGFDAEGNEYGYVFTEKMNNDGETIQGSYVPSSETKKVPETADLSATDTYEVFTNTISDYMMIQGKKTWTGLSGYQTKEENLPDPLISLYRTTDPEITDVQSKSEDEVKALISEGKIALVDTTHLSGSKADGNDKTQYVFPDKLPKFDQEGRRYTYLVRETIEDPIASQLYSQVNTNGTLSNVFRNDLNRRMITVTKTWAGRENLKDEEKKYPSVTYTLYRYEAGREETTTTKIETHTINSDEFSGQEGQASYTFKDLLIYSPAGAQYCYYITENKISGYHISYVDESGITDGTLEGKEISTGQNADGKIEKLKITKEMLDDLKKNDRIDIISLPENWNVANADDINTFTGTTNTYDAPGNVTISGEKNWDDYANSEGLRPSASAFKVKLTRHTNDEKGQNNKIEAAEIILQEKPAQDDNIKEPYIVWDRGEHPESSATWSYKIYNLERYAPNGMQYIYTLSEDQVTGYKKAADVEKQADSDKLTLASMTNQFDGTYYVRKNWMDGSNKYNLRPESITVKLQRSTDGENWSDMLSVDLSEKNVIKNTKNNSWDYTFTNLPTQNKDGKQYIYRCVEAAIGGVPVKDQVQEDGSTKYTSGAYECRYTTQNETKTVIENTLDSTSLVVTKKWEGDQDNLYQSRPDKLTFVLQKRGIKMENETEESETDISDTDESETPEAQLGDWEDVLLQDGTPYTFTISPDKDGNWTKTLEDLPTVEVRTAEDGSIYNIYSLYFRAVEVHVDDKTGALGERICGTTVSGAQNYKDVTDYSTSDTNKDHVYDVAKGCNESTITNKLVTDQPAKSVKATKIWRRVAGDAKEATFELLYKIQDEKDWHSYGQQILKSLTSSTAGEAGSVEWKDLPKYDKDGNLLLYKVIEHPVDGYRTEVTSKDNYQADGTYKDEAPYDTDYTFTNIELQNYTIEKIWQNTDYAEKTNEGYTATFKLLQKVKDQDWEDVKGYEPVTLTTKKANDTTWYTWRNLPKYTVDGEEITYRAVETAVNGKNLEGNTNGAYIVSYQYVGGDTTEKEEPAFQDTKTVATNRMIYGFVNLSKTAAYLAPEITEGGKLDGVKFNIYKGGIADGETTPYVSDVETDENGNLIQTNGKYGTEQKYLTAGTYTLKEISSGSDYSVWDKGIAFTIGAGSVNLDGSLKDTGEHGTAWISTEKNEFTNHLHLKTEYMKSTENSHYFGDNCTAHTNTDIAVNLESRGVLSFTKTGAKSDTGYDALDTHDGASGESQAYFGVYLDAACTVQVAGMIPKASAIAGSTDKATMILTDKAQDGTAITEQKDSNNIPYLRSYQSQNDSQSNYPFTLLSGTYYIKELTAPAGYKLDDRIRKAQIAKIGQTAMDSDLSALYPSNKAKIQSIQAEEKDEMSEAGVADYCWSNDPNVVTIYKRDQYGRKVPLSENGYLELSVEGDGNTFASGENTIRLYQNADLPATKTDGITKVDSITYNVENGTWTLKGLLDIHKTYTLSEPEGSVHDHYVLAHAIRFVMKADGTIVLADGENADTIPADDPLKVDGTDYKNTYKSDADNNVIVMRDVSRHLKDVVLEKRDAQTQQPIANISFELYQYESKDENGIVTGAKPVLETGVYLTTDSDGKIELKNLDDKIKNQITGCALKYGLDIGKYYWKEIEQGASDRYRLANPIYFEITPDETQGAEDYGDYAKVTYDTSDSHVTVSKTDNKTVIVTNDPVISQPKTLELLKVDSEDQQIKLAGAEFILTYKSVTHGSTGSATGDEQTKNLSWKCITGVDGELYLTDDTGKLPEEQSKQTKADISKKGHYELKETKAPDGYMTRTQNGTDQIVTLVTFDVDSDNQIKNIQYYDGDGNLVTGANPEISTDNSGEHIALNLIVKNEKTKVSIAKKNDIESNGNKNDTKTCNQKSLNGEFISGAELEIYEGTEITESCKKAVLGNGQSEWSWILPEGADENSEAALAAGTLKEDTIYTLHESHAPIGYLAADDIYFKLSGTISQNTSDHRTVSRLYVWTGKGKPETITGEKWQSTDHLNENVLTVVDEAVIAPVDMQKVVEKDHTYQVLPGARFEVKAGSVLLGTAKTTSQGYLVWDTISTNSNEGYDTKLIFNESGKRVTASDAETVIGKSIILQQNAEGYQFTEIYAPDQAYNEGKSFTVKITADNYKAYKHSTALSDTPAYDTSAYIDIQKANEALNEAGEHTYTVAELSRRDALGNVATKDDFVNPAFQTTFELYKYDAENSKINQEHDNYDEIGMKGVTFSLSKKRADGTYEKVGEYKTGTDGLLSITIGEKGTYRLQETATLTGYQIDDRMMEFTIVHEDYQKTLTYTEDENQPNHTVVIKDTNGERVDGAKIYGMANNRVHGTVTLTKKDAGTNEPLSGVQYVLRRISPEEMQEIRVTSDKNGVITLNDLQWGTYTLTEETELPGYKQENCTHTFTIGPDQMADQKLNYTFEDTNTKNSITFYKTNQADQEAGITTADIKALEGAVFEVHEGAGESHDTTCKKASFYTSNQSADSKTTTVITGSDGKVTIYGLPTDNTSQEAKVYHLVEVKAPKGYKLQTTPITFSIDRKGNVKIKNPDDEHFLDAVPEGQVTMTDEPVKIYIQKYGEDDTKLTGAEFVLTDICNHENSGEAQCDHKLANGAMSENLKITSQDGKIMIPVERLIGGHTYRLEETKAPDGYEATAVVTFHLKEDGTIDSIQSSGGYAGANGTCVSMDSGNTTIGIHDERNVVKLTKVDQEDAGKKLASVTFTLTPYGTGDAEAKAYTFTTDAEGQIVFPKGLLKHEQSYLLKETATVPGYYLGGEAKDGVILYVRGDGSIEVKRLPQYENHTMIGTAKSSCPVSVLTDSQGNIELISKNVQAASFELTKKVEGNMGDLNGTFQIKLEVYEPDGTYVGERTVKLKAGETYNSRTGNPAISGGDATAFGEDAFPVGAILVIKEENASDYAASIKITGGDAEVLTGQGAKNETARIQLKTAAKVSVELTNRKEESLDVGVDTENQAPWAAVSLIIPVIWLAYRYRRKRKGGAH